MEAKLPPPHGATLLDVSFTQPQAVTFALDAAAMQGSAAANGYALKYWANDGHHNPGNAHIAGSLRTYGHLWKTRVRCLNTLSEVVAARGPAVTKGPFLACAHSVISVALIDCQGSLNRGCAKLMVGAAGRHMLPGAEVPYED